MMLLSSATGPNRLRIADSASTSLPPPGFGEINRRDESGMQIAKTTVSVRVLDRSKTGFIRQRIILRNWLEKEGQKPRMKRQGFDGSFIFSLCKASLRLSTARTKSGFSKVVSKISYTFGGSKTAK